MNLPKFLTLKDNSLIYNQDNSTFVFYVPANYFNNSVKVPIAEYYGQYVSMIGVCNWGIIDENGKRITLKPFTFPTMFMCKPYETEKIKNLQLDNTEPSDYILLKFKKGDEVVSQIRVPQLIDNAEMFFKMAIMTAKIPTTIPYDRLWELFIESAALNGFNYKLNAQLFCLLISYICRDPKDISKRFNETAMTDMTKYRPIDIRMVPKFISPYTAITSENWDEAMRAAIELSGKEDTPESPLEKIVTM